MIDAHMPPLSVATSSLLDLESKYNRVIEEKTVLEQEIVQKQEVEEECQRLKDDVRGGFVTHSLYANPPRRQQRDCDSS